MAESMASLRDQILVNKTLHERNLVELDQAIVKIQKAIGEITANADLLRAQGIFIDEIINPNYEALRRDKAYSEQYQKKYLAVILEIKAKIQELLQ